MKRLLLIRHAKSSHDNEFKNDMERPLNKRGIQDTEKMGKVIRQECLPADLLLLSPAQRAKETWQNLATYAGQKELETLMEIMLYGGMARDYQDIIQKKGGKAKSIYLVAHNPNISNLASFLSGQDIEMPTCALVYLEFPLSHWQDLGQAPGKLLFYKYPKMID